MTDFVRSHLVALLFALLAVVAPFQAHSNPVSALTDYDFVVDVLRTDYAGFPTKTDGEKREEFERLVRQHRDAVERDPASLPAQVRALLGWFHDRHLGLSGPPSGARAAMIDKVPEARHVSATSVGRDRTVPSDTFFLRRLSPETLWLRLPDLAAEHRDEIETLLSQNDAALRSTPNLIIDLRDNSGGADSSYEMLMSYLYTRPIYSIGAEIRNSPRNVADLAATGRSMNLPVQTRAFIEHLVSRLRTSEEAWVSIFARDFTITTYPEILLNPKRVGIIATGASSSAEQFVIDARFSRKVTLFGGPTAGVIDFSNVAEAPLPSEIGYVLRWPMTRSLRLPEEPFDKVGVPPDVPFGTDVEDPIGAAQAWLEQRTD